jgi:hypothetical protein
MINRTPASRQVQIRTDSAGVSPWAIFDRDVRWWMVLGCSNTASYRVEIRAPQTGIACTVHTVGAAQARSDVFIGCPDLQVRIAAGAPNAIYIVACQGDDIPPWAV